MTRYAAIFLAMALGAEGCSSDTSGFGGGGGGTTDAGGGGTADTGRADTGRADTGRADTGRPDVGRPNENRCGQPFVTALCMCGMDQACQLRVQGGASMDCQVCTTEAAQSCCPAQYQALIACAMAMGCMDGACAAMRCPRENTALNTCFGMQQQSSTTCQNALAPCFGGFPIMCE